MIHGWFDIELDVAEMGRNFRTNYGLHVTYRLSGVSKVISIRQID